MPLRMSYYYTQVMLFAGIRKIVSGFLYNVQETWSVL